MSISIVTSKGESKLPPVFRTGTANWGHRNFQIYFDPRIYQLYYFNAVLPRIEYWNSWRTITVLYDNGKDRHQLGFQEVRALSVEGNPLPEALKRIFNEIQESQIALVYGTLRGQNRDHGKVFSWIPRPEMEEPCQLLLVIQ
jgi:hypothetical protein